jgi:glycosyl hydrolase family 57
VDELAEVLMTLERIPEIVDGLPNISGWEEEVRVVTRSQEPVFLPRIAIDLERVQAAFAIGLHMHQPLILDGDDLTTARMMGNLQYMMENQQIHGNHDAPVFAQCYRRTADLVRELVDLGRRPRVMLDYSGCLLFGLRQMGRGDILDNLRTVVDDERYWPYVEWLGTTWGHAVVPSTPIPDIELHVRAWQHHFAAVFGWAALARVRGFSPPEMHLPNHPDVCFHYVKTLRACGYRWLVVQEHSVEELDGSSLHERYLPRRLVARSSSGQEVSITALIKTQGSDTKLVGHMQPFHEARGMRPREFRGRRIPPLALQVSDGENGGVMMNEFPGHYRRVWDEVDAEGVVGINGTEYLERLEAAGFSEKDFEPIQPLHQHAIWQRVGGSSTPERVVEAIEEANRADHRFHMEGSSWTSDRSWGRGYETVLDPMNRLSVEFHEIIDRRAIKASRAYRNALLHLLVSQTSCYRYWGSGRWTDIAVELCRRGSEILTHDF